MYLKEFLHYKYLHIYIYLLYYRFTMDLWTLESLEQIRLTRCKELLIFSRAQQNICVCLSIQKRLFERVRYLRMMILRFFSNAYVWPTGLRSIESLMANMFSRLYTKLSLLGVSICIDLFCYLRRFSPFSSRNLIFVCRSKSS